MVNNYAPHTYIIIIHEHDSKYILKKTNDVNFLVKQLPTIANKYIFKYIISLNNVSQKIYFLFNQ